MQDVVKTKILKLLDNGIIYPISDSQWVSPVYDVPKKTGFTVVVNEHKELVQIRLPTKVRVCIDYRDLCSVLWILNRVQMRLMTFRLLIVCIF